MASYASTKLLTLSDIRVIDSETINPHTPQAQVKAQAICGKLGIKLEIFDGYTTMSPYLFPTASEKRLVPLIVIMNLLYYIDEVYDRHAREVINPTEDIALRRIFDNCIPILLEGKMPEDDHILYPAVYQIYELVTPLVNANWMQRFVMSLLQHLKSTTYTLDDILKTKGGDPIEQYIKLRELDGGMRPTMNMAEMGLGIYLPDEIKMHPYIQAIELATASIGGLMNDLFSYENEVLVLNSRFNLVALFQDYRDMTFEEAVHETVKVVNGYTSDFLRLEQNIPDFEDEHTYRMVSAYVNALRHQVNATWHWQMSTNRYRSTKSPFPELRQIM